jgi:capsule polysaccharide export protein KpsE/RkpR
MESKPTNLLSLLSILFRWRKPILLFTLFTSVASVVVTLLMPDFYAAEAKFLAISPEQSRPENLFGGSEQIRYYGGEEDIDRLLIIAESNVLIDQMVDSFKLYKHYNINPTFPKAHFKVRRKFSSYYSVEKTDRDAISLIIEDKNPALAAQMVQYAGFLIDEKAKQLIKDGYSKMINSLNSGIAEKQIEIKVLGDSLSKTRQKYNIFNTKTQSEIISEQFDVVKSAYIRTNARLSNLKTAGNLPKDTIQYIEAEAEGLKVELDTLEKRVSMLNEGQLTLNELEVRYYSYIDQISQERQRLKLLYSAQNANIPALLEMENAEIPLMKSRPKRTLIVLGVTLGAFFLSIFLVILLDQYKEINWKEVLHD